ncbi:MAG: phosphate/phosphite/phosphonate ABC transporter substrate-binding protein [Candidatus Thiodiazotropha lotti]|nr:phosphate/phosphite/phosphonate ABC transporter substrate-binding protein [Candidatus Thiodiazotropha lotti]
MLRPESLIYRLAFLSALLLTCSTLAALEPARNGEAVYSFGVVPQFEQRKLFRIWRPILDELERRTKLTFQLVGSPKIPVFEQKFKTGIYDFAYMNPYHILIAKDKQGYEPLVRDGNRSLSGILVVAKESPYEKPSDLSNYVIAFPAPNALGASLLMRADLAELHGIEVHPKYVKTHSSVYLHVATGLTEAGGGVLRTLQAQDSEVRDRLRVLYKTRPMNPHPIAAHPRVPTEHKEQVRRAILDMAETPQGKELLSKIPIQQAVRSSIEDYSELREWNLEKYYLSH